MKYELKHYTEDKNLIDEILAIMAIHALERVGEKNYAPDVVKIVGLWKMGVLRLVTMRSHEDKLIGYQGWLLSTPVTNTFLKQATLSYIFVEKESRGSATNFLEFVKYGVAAVKILGAVDILAGVDGDQPWLLDKFKLAGFTTERARQIVYTGG